MSMSYKSSVAAIARREIQKMPAVRQANTKGGAGVGVVYVLAVIGAAAVFGKKGPGFKMPKGAR